jgi:hypothetical protein
VIGSSQAESNRARSIPILKVPRTLILSLNQRGGTEHTVPLAALNTHMILVQLHTSDRSQGSSGVDRRSGSDRNGGRLAPAMIRLKLTFVALLEESVLFPSA